MPFRVGTIAIIAGFLTCTAAQAQLPPPDVSRSGEEIYNATCATCHDNPQGRIPDRHAIAITHSADYILRVLNEGAMQSVAAGLTAEQKIAVAAYLVNVMPGSGSHVDLNANRCNNAPPPLSLNGPSWNGWGGGGITNLRHQPNSRITASNLRKLKLKWAFALPAGTFSQPSVVGGRVFAPSLGGVVFSLDARTGCTYWAVDVGSATRTPIVIGKAGTRLAAFFGDNKGRIHAVDAQTGKKLWDVQVEAHPMTRLTGAPTIFEGRLYVPVSSYEEVPDPKYHCCTFRGSLVALDAATGRQIWKAFTLDQPAQPLADGYRLGPSGVAIWHAPTIDAKRRLIYVSTGNSYSDPPVEVADAIIALDLDTGAKRWVRQTLAKDVNVAGCAPSPVPAARSPNCPDEPGPDFDLAGPPLLVTTPDGKDHLIASSKSGDIFGLNLEAQGAILWTTRLGRGSALGGVEWGGASDGVRAYFTIGDSNDVRLRLGTTDRGPPMPGINAVSPATGALLWHTPAPAPVCAWGMPCLSTMTASPLVTPGVVFAGSSDGHERAYSAKDGRMLWEFDTGRSFATVNGGTANGGSIDQGGQAVVGSMLFVTSGGRARPGNALLAFTVDR